MNIVSLTFVLVIIVAAAFSAFAPGFRTRLLSAWVTSLALGFLFLLLKNELLAITLTLLSTAVTWVVIGHTLVFGDFQEVREPSLGWRGYLVPALGGLMILGMLYLGTPASVFESLELPEPIHVVLSELGTQALSRFFLLSVIVAAVAFGSVVGIGMIARAEWRRDGGNS